MKKVGLLITTYNRGEYLRQCLNSLALSDLSHINQILVVDDASTDALTKELLVKVKTAWKGSKVWVNAENKGIHNNIRLGSELLFDMGCDVVINLDPDTVVKSDWALKLLELHYKFPTTIASGFNTLSRHPGSPTPRHDVFEWFDTYVTKSSIGGINMVYSFSMYHKIIKQHLIALNWDWRICREFQSRHWLFVITRPSVVQHIGIGEGMHPSNNPDVAYDYD